MVQPTAAIVLLLLSTMVASSDSSCLGNCSFTKSKHCCLRVDLYGDQVCVCNSPTDGDYILVGRGERVTSIKCPGYACMTGFACPKIEGPYKRESVEQFGINLGDVDELEIGCPLQDAVEVLDGLKVSRVSEKLTVNWCHMHVNRTIHDDKQRLMSLHLRFEEFAGNCTRPENESSKIDPLPEDFGEKLGGAGTEVLWISHAHENAPITLMGHTFRGLSALRELTIDDTDHTLQLMPNAFAGLPNLANLTLNMCRIKDIDATVFNISSLRYLDLSGNEFRDIPKNLFKLTSSLEVIKLTDVPYEGNWTSDMLPGTLREFYFSPRKVTSAFVDEELFKKCCPDLETVSIQGSRLPSNDLSIFNGLKKLRTLDVCENSLRDLKWEPVPETLEKLTLIRRHNLYRGRENRFNCTCANVDSFGQLKGQLNDTINEELRCGDDEGVDVFDDAGKSGMALNSILKDRCDSLTYLEIVWATVTAALAVMVLILLANLRHRHKVYKMNRGSIGPFEYDAFISYATSPSLDAGDEDDPEERFVRNLIEGLEGGSGGERNSSIRINWHRKTFELGGNVVENMREQMAVSRCILVVASRSSFQSIHCNTEFDQAIDLDKKMLVVMRTGENAPTTEQVGETSAELRRLIRQETYLEEEASMESQVERLRRRLLKMRELKEDRVGRALYGWQARLKSWMGRGTQGQQVTSNGILSHNGHNGIATQSTQV